MLKRRAMTLTEVLLTVAILSILGSLAIVTYVKVYEKSRGAQAITILRMIRTAERLYYLDWNEYEDLPTNCNSDLVQEGYIQCPNQGSVQDRSFDYGVNVGGGGTDYTASATKISGGFLGEDITLNVTCCPETPTWGGSWEWRPTN